jgi:hypothetical protein
MVRLDLDNEETMVLSNLLEECVGDLNHQIARTERSEYREMLKTRQDLLKKILSRLRVGISTPLAA